MIVKGRLNPHLFTEYVIKSPCKNCEKRTLGCHTTCEDYLEYKKKLEEKQKEYKNERDKIYR